jgi:hypothetical protein
MTKLTIKEINKFNEYVLEDKDKNNYSLIMEFYDVQKPEVGDTLLLHENLLNKNSAEYSQPYSFGALDNKCGREKSLLTETEIIGLQYKNKKIMLKRIYG